MRVPTKIIVLVLGQDQANMSPEKIILTQIILGPQGAFTIHVIFFKWTGTFKLLSVEF